MYTDASLFAIGGILAQNDDSGQERVVQYISHQLSAGQRKWPCIEREAYAIVFCVSKLRPFLLGAQFTIFTDHKPLQSLFVSEMKNPRVQRWAIMLDEYGASIEYHPGKKMKADFVSRIGTSDSELPEVLDSDPSTETGATPAPDSSIPPTVKDSHDMGMDTAAVIDTDNLECLERPTCQDDMNEVVHTDETTRQELLALTSGTQFAKAQQCDPFLQPIYEQLNTEGSLADYVIDDGLLYHVAQPVRKDQQPHLQLVIPDRIIPTLLSECHDKDGHLGVDKLYDKLRLRYYWDTMYRDCVDKVSNCLVCNKRNLRKRHTPMQNMPIPEFPFQICGIDTCGPYPDSESGNRYIITIVDHFSGWPEAYPVPNKQAVTVAKVLLEDFIPRHACPQVLISDQGTEFCNSVIDALTKNLNIHKIRTTPYHPQTNGKVERFHRLLNDVLGKHVNRGHLDWDKWIPCALSAYRTSINETTGYSPFEVVYGRHPCLPMDTLLQPKFRYMGEDYLPTMIERLHHVYTDVKQNILQAQDRNKHYHDRKLNPEDLRVGDLVYYCVPNIDPGPSQKLGNSWRSQFQVVEKISEVTYRIRHQPSGVSKVVHLENLRKANPTEAWEKEYEEATEVCHKSKPSHDYEDDAAFQPQPKRRQPLRNCRLTSPLAGCSRNQPEPAPASAPASRSDAARPHPVSGGRPMKRARESANDVHTQKKPRYVTRASVKRSADEPVPFDDHQPKLPRDGHEPMPTDDTPTHVCIPVHEVPVAPVQVAKSKHKLSFFKKISKIFA